jgi:uncharacterized protein YndB with AHSA1/START domain
MSRLFYAGGYDVSAMEGVVVSVRAVLAAPPAAVWSALLDPQAWWAREAEVEPRPGGRYRIRLDQKWIEGRIASIDPPRELAVVLPFESAHVSFDTTLRFGLAPENSGTAVSIEHTGPPVMAWMGERRELERGWRETLVRLSNHLRGAV